MARRGLACLFLALRTLVAEAPPPPARALICLAAPAAAWPWSRYTEADMILRAGGSAALAEEDLAHGTGKDDYKETTWGVAVSAKEEDEYPKGGLKCFYSNKVGYNTGYADMAPLEAILCPEGQNAYCVLVIVNGLARTECGMTEYFGDKYEILDNLDEECMYRGCASTCVKDQVDVHSEYIEDFREKKTYKRDTLCCNTDYCNGAGALGPSRALAAALGVLALLLHR